MNVRQSFPRPWWPPATNTVGLAVAIGVPAALLLGAPAEWQLGLRYERSAVVEQHQWWRLVTGQWLHLGWRHGVVNLAAWLMMCLLLVPALGTGRVSLVLLGSVAGTAAGLLWHGDLAWYVGLSGALHGMLAGAMVVAWRRTPAQASLVLALVTAKLVAEQMLGEGLTGTLAAGVRVVTEAHVWGAIGGVLIGLALALFPRRAACV